MSNDLSRKPIHLPKQQASAQEEASVLCQFAVCSIGITSLLFLGTAIALYAGEF